LGNGDARVRAMIAFDHLCQRQVDGDVVTGAPGRSVALRGRQAEPFVSFDIGFKGVFGQPLETGAAMLHSQMVLRAGVSLLCCHAHPHRCLGFILGHALSAGEHHTEIELGQGMVLVGRLKVPVGRLGVIWRHGAAAGELQAQAELRLGIPLVRLDLGFFQGSLLRAVEQISEPGCSHDPNGTAFGDKRKICFWIVFNVGMEINIANVSWEVKL
jgi:hypothetical protein